MPRASQDYARRVFNELESIKRLIVDAISHPRTQGESSSEKERQTKDSKHNSQTGGQPAKPKTKPSVGGNHESTSTQKERFPKVVEWKPVIEVAGIAALVIYTGITALAWRESHRANKIAFDALVTSQRAFVSAKDPFLVGDGGMPGIASGKPAFLAVNLNNSGGTPARKGSVDINFCATNVPIPDSFAFPISKDQSANCSSHPEQKGR